MNKILRYSFVALMAMMGFGNAMAEDVIWQEDWSTWGDYAKAVLDGVNPNYAFTGTVTKDDGTFKSGTTIYNENLAGGEAPELLVAKNGGSFTATVDLNGKSGTVKLSFKCNKAIDVEVTGGTITATAAGGNDYVYGFSDVSGTLTITFKNSLSANARLDDIKLYQGQSKKPAGLSWGTSSRTVTIGADDNIFPQLTNDNNLAVTYSSSETGVATIDAEGKITLVAAGETVITAESAETDEFAAGKAEYKLTVKEAQGGGGGDPTGKGSKDNPYTVAEALAALANMANNVKTDEVYVKGEVYSITEISVDYGNATFLMGDEGASDGKTITVFRSKYFNKANFTSEDQVMIGDKMVICGQLINYLKNGAEEGTEPTPEIAQGCYVYMRNGKTSEDTPEPQVEEITVAKALELAAALEDNGYSATEYKVKGFVVGTPAIDKKKDGTFYGNAKFYMADTKDGAETIYAYQIYGLNGENMESEDYLKDGDEVIVQGKLQKYVKDDVTTLEIAKGGKIVELNGKTNISALKADQLKSAAIYNLAGQRVNDNYKGVVIKAGKKVVMK